MINCNRYLDLIVQITQNNHHMNKDTLLFQRFHVFINLSNPMYYFQPKRYRFHLNPNKMLKYIDYLEIGRIRV